MSERTTASARPRPWKRWRVIASAAGVPSASAIRVLSVATSSEVTRALVRSGIANSSR